MGIFIVSTWKLDSSGGSLRRKARLPVHLSFTTISCTSVRQIIVCMPYLY